MKKSSKELLFERMEAVNPDFKRPQENVPNSEQDIVNDILSLNEGIDSILNKVKEYGKRGLLTATILLAVALGANAQSREYAEIMRVGREYAEVPYIDSSGVQHVGKERWTNADFNVTDVNYFYLSLAVQRLNMTLQTGTQQSIIDMFGYPPIKISPEVDEYGDEIPISSSAQNIMKTVNDAYYFAMDLYNILQSSQTDKLYDKINSQEQIALLFGATGWVAANNGVNRIKAYIVNGKNIKLVNGKFVGGLNNGEFPSPAQ